MEEFLGALLLAVPRDALWYKVYADDLVFITNHSNLRGVLKQMRRTANDFGLILNEKKSGILAVQRHRKLGEVQEIDGFPVIDEYCYLGVRIDDRGAIDLHLTKLR